MDDGRSSRGHDQAQSVSTSISTLRATVAGSDSHTTIENCRTTIAARIAFVLLAAALGLLASAPRADAALAWRDGLITETLTYNCITQYTEYGIGAFVGQLYDTSYTQPYVGQRFYMRIHVVGLGHPCSDYHLDVQFVPPAGVTASAVPDYPLRCFYQAPGSTTYNEFGAADGCPQPPFGLAPNSGGTGFRIDRRRPGDPLPAWFLPGGGGYEFWVPVISDRPLDGLQANTSFDVPIQAIDGIFNSWTYPSQSVYVATADPVFANGFQ